MWARVNRGQWPGDWADSPNDAIALVDKVLADMRLPEWVTLLLLEVHSPDGRDPDTVFREFRVDSFRSSVAGLLSSARLERALESVVKQTYLETAKEIGHRWRSR